MQRTHGRIGFALAAALAVGVLAGTPALAGNTRTVFFGSAGTASVLPADGLGVLHTKPVTVGGATATDVILQNLSPSQLTHVIIQGGTDADPTATANSSFLAPVPICTTTGGTSSCITSLPPNTTYAGVYVLPFPASTVAATCPFTLTSFTCTVANMAPNDVVQIRVILQPPAAVTTNDLQFWLSSSLKEGTSNTGSNQDTFFTYGHFAVTAPTCAAVSTFFTNGEHVGLSNANTPSCTQVTDVSSNGVFTQGAFELVGANEVAPGTFCTPGASNCGFGGVSQADVNDGVQPSGSFVTWDITWSGIDLPTSKPKGVTHFAADGTVIKTIYFKAAQQCTTATPSDCWVNTFSTKTSFEAIFRTPNNGFVRGF